MKISSAAVVCLVIVFGMLLHGGGGGGGGTRTHTRARSQLAALVVYWFAIGAPACSPQCPKTRMKMCARARPRNESQKMNGCLGNEWSK